MPQEFVDQYLIDLHVKHVVAGFDYSYGGWEKGQWKHFFSIQDNSLLFPLLINFNLKRKKLVQLDSKSYIKEGEMEQISPLLGRFYHTRGKVIHGEKRGRTIGFPTANVDIEDEYLFHQQVFMR